MRRLLHLILTVSTVLLRGGTATAAESTATPPAESTATPPASVVAKAEMPRVTLGAGYKHAFLPRSISDNAAAMNADLRVVRRLYLSLTGSLFVLDRDYSTAPNAPRRTQALGMYDVDVKWFVATTHDRSAELYVCGGVGGIWTKPVSIRDPSVRHFDWEHRLAFAHGVGGRLALGPRLALFTEARVTTFVDSLENQELAPAAKRSDRMTWLDWRAPLTNMVDLQLGLAVHLWE